MRKISMILPLSRDPEKLWAAFTTKHRTTIRRAMKNGLTVESGGAELLGAFYEVLELTWRELGTPIYARDYFERVVSTFPDECRIFICRQHRQPIAAALNGYCAGTVEGLWSGSVPAARNLQANYVLYWEMIRDACLQGCSRFHFGRSTAGSGAEDFKRKWNAERHQLYGYVWRRDGGTAPALSVDNPRFRLAISTWRRLPLVLTRAIGPRVARCIP
jgi:FemAB-related protein (PEP-CTERM system-associated)